MKAIVTAALGGALVITAAGCASTTHAARTATTATVTPAAAASTTPAPPAPAVPNPDGTYSGSCDYTLSDSFSMDNAGTLIGEIDLENTGNIGTVTRARISWPQEGFAPVVAARTIRVAYGKSKTIRFHVTASQNVIAGLQSWQEKHDYRDGCHYHATITGTFGAAH